tara:strand:+ start:1097 stop:2581 length:1485 start_codon:yes stop_codon:yes gene_type:complete
MRPRIRDDGSFIYEPSNLDRARFFVDIPYFFSHAFDPAKLGDVSSDDFTQSGRYITPDSLTDRTLMNFDRMNREHGNPLPEELFDDNPESDPGLRAAMRDTIDNMERAVHPYNFFRDRLAPAMQNLSMDELASMTRGGYTPDKELMRDMASLTPNPRSYHDDVYEMFLPNKRIPLKRLPKSIMDIVSPGPEGAVQTQLPSFMRPRGEANKRGFRDRAKRLASLEAAVEANRRAEALNEANMNLRENVLQSFFPTIPAVYGPRPYSRNAGLRMPRARTFYPDRYGGSGANPPSPLFTFDEDDEASAVIMNEAFPEQFQLINRSEDAFEDAWRVVKDEEFVDDVDDDYVLPIKEQMDLTPDDWNYLLEQHDREALDYLEYYLRDLQNPKKTILQDFGDTSKIPYFTRSEDLVEDVWALMKSIPTDIMNDPLVYISPDGMIKTVRLERPFRKWLYESGYPTDDDFAQLDFIQKMQILFHYRVQQGASKEQSFMEDNV